MQSCSTLCDPKDSRLPSPSVSLGLCSNPVHRVKDAIRPSCPMSSPVLSSIFPSLRVCSSESALHIRWPKYWPGGSVVKNGPAVQETQIRSLCRGDPLEKEMATCSSILAWRIPWMEKLGGLYSMWSQRVRHDLGTKQF